MAAEPESPEIFDDLYLGLRAGGALRKQRRGEPLTTEEQEVLGRWNRLSFGRKRMWSSLNRLLSTSVGCVCKSTGPIGDLVRSWNLPVSGRAKKKG